MKEMKKMLITLVALGSMGLVFAAGGKDKATAESTLKGSYTFGGSTTVQPIANGIIEALMAANPELKISYEGLGSSTGLKQLTSGTISLAGSSRDLKSSELEQNLVPVVIAKDGIAVVVNKSVNIANLSKEQLAAIYAGEITNWKEIGGNDLGINVINRDESSGTYGSFKEIVLDPVSKAYTKNAIVAKENGEVAAKVAATPGAIGYVGLGFVGEVTQAGGKALSVDGIKASTETVLDGTYPVSRSLYVASKGAMVEGSIEAAFVSYALSPRGTVIVKDAGFVPVQ